jgi:nucleoside-diphosphate-sugar epimerase
MFIDDFASGLADLGEHDGALGRAWHLPTPPPGTARTFLEEVFGHAGRPLRVARLGATAARVIGVAWPVAREGAEMLHQFHQPHSVDATAYLDAFGPGRVTSHREGIEATVRWYRSAPRRPLTALGR